MPRIYEVIYLVLDEEEHQMRMLFLGDTREDPLHRFDRMEVGE